MVSFMEKENDTVLEQNIFIEKMRKIASDFVSQIDKTCIQTVLLSGSVARGDFSPGKYGGMIDLVFMKKPDCGSSGFDPAEIFGEDEDSEIPYHCVRRYFEGSEIWFEIDIREFVSAGVFEKFDEARKFSILESKILYDEGDLYSSEFEKIRLIKNKELPKFFKETFQVINSLLNPYAKDKWFRRNAFSQLHQNLNSAIMLAVRCLYYKNGSYVPPENRILYYTYSLEKLPENYKFLLSSLFQQQIDSYSDYERREKLFKNEFMKFLI